MTKGSRRFELPTCCALGAVAISLTAPTSAQNGDIVFQADLEVSCTLVSENGRLAPNDDYTVLSTEERGGRSAQLSVTSLGGLGQVQFSAPILNTLVNVPARTPEIKFRSRDGIIQGFTDSASSHPLLSRADVFEVDARVAHEQGFDAGRHEIVTFATCSAR